MGYDIYASGGFVIKADRIDEARPVILSAIAEKQGYDNLAEYLDEMGYEEAIEAAKRIDLAAHFGDALENMKCTLQGGELCFQPPEGSFRREEEDLWLLRAIAPFCDPDCNISFEGEDGYKWRWDIVNGPGRDTGWLEEVDSETVYGHDINAPAVVKRIVDLIYPEELKGRPITTQSLEPYEVEAALVKVEALLREANFGPQAGKNELERLADV